MKKFDSIFGNDCYQDFFSPKSMREEIEQKYSGLILGLNKNNPCYEARKISILWIL